MKKLLNVCRKVKDLTDEELEEAQRMARYQMEYISPLRPKSQGEQNALGRYNTEVVAAVGALRELIRRGPPKPRTGVCPTSARNKDGLWYCIRPNGHDGYCNFADQVERAPS
jgi:hypothetical protein